MKKYLDKTKYEKKFLLFVWEIEDRSQEAECLRLETSDWWLVTGKDLRTRINDLRF